MLRVAGVPPGSRRGCRAGSREAGGVGEQMLEGDRLRERRRNLEPSQIAIDVVAEAEAATVGQLDYGSGSEDFADGSDAPDGLLGVHAALPLDVRKSVSALIQDFSVLN